MPSGDDQDGLRLYTLIQHLIGGIGFITLIFFMTFVAFSILYSWRLVSSHKLGDDDVAFEIISRYASTRLFKVHLAAYIAALVLFVASLLLNRLE